jgi:hypothetical protein
MGHVRLGTLPDTRPWRMVVAQIADGATVAAVAGATSTAAVRGLKLAEADPGLAHVVYLLAHTALAARQPDFARALAALHVTVPDDPGLFDLTAGFAEALRQWRSASRTPQSDIGEMAALAAVEALTRCVGERSRGLFPTGGEVHAAAREFSTRAGFAGLAHEFYARFTQRFLLYHLGRELSQHVGGNGRFADPAAHAAFVADLDTHCREAAIIVRSYAGGWYDKAKFEEGITEDQARRFAAYSVTKLGKELEARGARNG